MLNGSAMKMASRSIDVISKKNKFARAARFFVFLCSCFAPLQGRFVRLKHQTSQLHIIFMEELSYVLTKDFAFCVHVHFYFFTTAHFHLAVSSSHFLTATMKFSCFPSNEIRLPRSSSVIHVSVNIKNNVEKDKNFVFFSLSKSSGGHAIFFRCNWVAIPVD